MLHWKPTQQNVDGIVKAILDQVDVFIEMKDLPSWLLDKWLPEDIDYKHDNNQVDFVQDIEPMGQPVKKIQLIRYRIQSNIASKQMIGDGKTGESARMRTEQMTSLHDSPDIPRRISKLAPATVSHNKLSSRLLPKLPTKH